MVVVMMMMMTMMRLSVLTVEMFCTDYIPLSYYRCYPRCFYFDFGYCGLLHRVACAMYERNTRAAHSSKCYPKPYVVPIFVGYSQA